MLKSFKDILKFIFKILYINKFDKPAKFGITGNTVEIKDKTTKDF